MMNTNLSLESVMEKIDSAKLDLMSRRNTTFFSVLLAQMSLVASEKARAWINGYQIGLKPDFVEEITLPELIGTLLHEILHVALEHLILMTEYRLNPNLSNIAGDLYINHWIKGMGYVLPADHLDENWSHGMGFLEIYEELEKRQKNNPENSPGLGKLVPNLPEGWEDMVGPPEGTNEVAAREHMLSVVIQAAQEAERRNDYDSVPGEIKQLIERSTSPKLPWDEMLRKYAMAYSKDDYSMSRPNRRYMQTGLYLPTLRDEKINDIFFTFDVSGSVYDEQLAQVLSEGEYIYQLLKPERMTLVSWDTRITMVKRYEHLGNWEQPEITGRGGTNVQPVLDMIVKERPEFAVIFTDGYFGHPDMSKIKDIDIYWLIFDNNDFKPPDNHGKVIYFDKFLRG